jgi:hypothetical protein
VVLPRDLVALLVLQGVRQGVRLDVVRRERDAAVRADGGGIGVAVFVVVDQDDFLSWLARRLLLLLLPLLRFKARAHVLLEPVQRHKVAADGALLDELGHRTRGVGGVGGVLGGVSRPPPRPTARAGPPHRAGRTANGQFARVAGRSSYWRVGRKRGLELLFLPLLPPLL